MSDEEVETDFLGKTIISFKSLSQQTKKICIQKKAYHTSYSLEIRFSLSLSFWQDKWVCQRGDSDNLAIKTSKRGGFQ